MKNILFVGIENKQMDDGLVEFIRLANKQNIFFKLLKVNGEYPGITDDFMTVAYSKEKFTLKEAADVWVKGFEE